jgi:nicotinate-nucleotide adenylyltransferase
LLKISRITPTKKMKTAIYSGSFNPLHIGHLAIMKHMVEEAGYDMVYLIVSPKNPLKDGISSTSGQERFEAATEAVARHFNMSEEQKVKVDDIELTMPEPHYTIRTLDALKEREPDNEFTFIMGADNLADIRRWRDYGRILREYGVAVYPREGVYLEEVKADLLEEDKSYRIEILDAPMVEISSTDIREGIAAGKDMREWLM